MHNNAIVETRQGPQRGGRRGGLGSLLTTLLGSTGSSLRIGWRRLQGSIVRCVGENTQFVSTEAQGFDVGLFVEECAITSVLVIPNGLDIFNPVLVFSAP